MKKYRKILTVTLSVVLAAGSLACNAPIADVGRGDGWYETEETPILYEDGLHEREIGNTAYPFVENGTTVYEIVCPAQPAAEEEAAVSELNFFFSAATGTVMPVRSDADVDFDAASSQYIVVGETRFTEENMPVDYDEVRTSGYRIETVGKSVFISGATPGGTVNGVYDFLSETVGYRFYAADELRVDLVQNRMLPDFSVTEAPDFEYRESNYGEVLNDSSLLRRMRMNKTADMYLFGHNCHNSFTVLPPQRIAGDLPWTEEVESETDSSDDWTPDSDWYNQEGNQLCYSNESMIAQYIENLKGFIRCSNDGDLQGNIKRVMLCGMEDNHGWCSCDDCLAVKNKYGSNSAVMILFINRVSAEINEWIRAEVDAEAQPMRFIFFAYYATEEAPTQNIGSGAGELAFAPNTGIMYAAASMDFMKTFHESEGNRKYYENLERWSALTDIIHFWAYPLYAWQYLVPHNPFGAMQSIYADLLNHGTVSLLDQTKYSQPVSSGFARLHMFLERELQWNVNQNVGALIDEFFVNYFRDAAEDMRNYFEELRAWYNHLQQTDDTFTGQWGFIGVGGTAIESAGRYFPQSVLERWLEFTAAARESVSSYRQTDPELYEKLVYRIELEELSIRYILLGIYRNNYPYEQRQQMLLSFYEDFNASGLGTYCEGTLGNNMTEIWKAWGLA